MAERRGNRDKAEDELPVYLARPGTADQVPRQKYGGLFCSVEGAFESKTIDFDALSVGQRGSRTPRTAKRETGQEARSPATERRSTDGAERQRETAQPEIRSGCGKEVLQNLGEEKVRTRRTRRRTRRGRRKNKKKTKTKNKTKKKTKKRKKQEQEDEKRKKNKNKKRKKNKKKKKRGRRN